MKSFQKYLKNLDAIFISTRANIIYLTGYAGFSETERECFLLITKTLPVGKAGKQYLITDRRYSQALKKLKNFEIIETGAKNFITRDHNNILKNLRMARVGIEENDLSVSEYKILKKNLKNTKNLDLSKFRIIKNADEIKNIKLACKIGDQAFDVILSKLKLEVTEQEAANELELFVKKKGGEFSFRPIVAFGKNSSIPHHQTGKNKLKKNQIVLLDFGVKINNYCSDMTRTIFFGKADDKFKKMHKTVLEAQTKAIKSIKSQLLAKDIDKVARDHIASNNYPNIPHSVGHGIGIEVHESPQLSPNSKDKLERNMIFSIEPGIYIPNFGGVRIEDLVLVGKNRIETITHSNRGIIEI